MFGGENFEKEVDRGTDRTGGDWRCRGRFPSSEAIKPVGRKTSRRKERCYGTVPIHSGGQCPPPFTGSFGSKPEVPKQNRSISIGAAFADLVPGYGAG